MGARQIQTGRYKVLKNIHYNAKIGQNQLDEFCTLNETGKKLIKSAMERLNLSASAYNPILRVAPTIAALEQVETLASSHIVEAIQ